jgi:translation initiation factor IF-1
MSLALAKSAPAVEVVEVAVVVTAVEVAVGDTAAVGETVTKREAMGDRGTDSRCPRTVVLGSDTRGPASFNAPSSGSAPGCQQRLKPATAPNRLMKETPVEVEGVIHTVLPGTMFRVELDNKHLVLAAISGKMRKRWVRLTVGDRVKMEMSPYDLDKARIVWRLK